MAENKNVQLATDSNFDTDILKGSGLSMVDFWAEWCGPCRMLAPTVDAIATEFAGKLRVYKMNVDENPNTPAKFHIRGIPTVIFFKNGQPVDQVVGVRSKEDFSTIVKKHI